MERQLQNCNYFQIPNLQRSQPADKYTIITVICELKPEFASRFADFRLYAGDLSLFWTPFNADIKSVLHNLQMEVTAM